MSEIINRIKSGFTNFFNKFSQPSQVGVSGNSFLGANTIIAKFAFLILIIFLFLYLLSLGVYVINYLLSPPSNPYIIYGMSDGGNSMVVYQDPSHADSKFIARSNNQTTGVEFTWSTWLFVGDIANYNTVNSTSGNGTCQTGTNTAAYQHIFNKGDSMYDSNNLATINNCPGLYLSTSSNKLHLIMDTLDSEDPNNTIDIDNIPIKKWFHLAIRVKNTILDVYINGVIAQRLLLTNLPKQNYENIYICQKGGFTGNISNLRYYQYALNVFEINNIVNYGPNLVQANNANVKDYHYLSKKWYSYNQ
jgi:hypothetical protein